MFYISANNYFSKRICQIKEKKISDEGLKNTCTNSVVPTKINWIKKATSFFKPRLSKSNLSGVGFKPLHTSVYQSLDMTL